MRGSLRKKVIVIAGASSGMGLCAAELAAQRGAKVVLAARNEHDLREAAERIRRNGGEAIAVPTDVTDLLQVRELGRRAAEEFGRIDAWITTAAVSAYAPFEELPLADFRQIMEVNFMGQVHCASVALPYLEQSTGVLVCVGSALSDRGVPLQGAYCASKHALKGWLDSLRVELRKRGSRVRVTLVKPSSIDTPLFNKAKTQLGVMPQPIPPVYRPELAARTLLWAVEHNARDIFVGGSGRFLSFAEQVSPRLVDLQQLRQGFEAQKTDWPKSAAAPNNLYEALTDDGGVRGDFSHHAKARSVYQSAATHRIASTLGLAALVGVGILALRRRRRPARTDAQAWRSPLTGRRRGPAMVPRNSQRGAANPG